ncbi:MAG: ribokinase [Lentisphaeria bacterium]|nr:ribokinase [Lentisphaeria bacterium]
MPVLNFGSLNIDHVYQVPHFVAPGETLTAHAYSRGAGGKGLNQSIALARAGIPVAHAGKIGPEGEFLAETLQKAGVDTSRLIRSQLPTGHAVIQVEAQAGNSILLFPGANTAITREEIVAILGDFPAGSVLILQNEVSHVDFLLQEGARLGLQIAINPAPCSPEVAAYPLGAAKWLFLNEIEAEQLSGIADPQEALTALRLRYPQTAVILTLGAEGAWYAGAEGTFFQVALPADAVDTTAAGDTFLAYFMAAILESRTPQEALLLAAQAAAITVSRPGAADSIPCRKELE